MTRNQKVTDAWTKFVSGDPSLEEEALLQETLSAGDATALELLEDRQMDALLAAMNRLDHHRDAFTRGVMEACSSQDTPLAGPSAKIAAPPVRNRGTQPVPNQHPESASPSPSHPAVPATPGSQKALSTNEHSSHSRGNTRRAGQNAKQRNRLPFALASIFACTTALLLCMVLVQSSNLKQQRQVSDQMLVRLETLNSQLSQLQEKVVLADAANPAQPAARKPIDAPRQSSPVDPDPQVLASEASEVSLAPENSLAAGNVSPAVVVNDNAPRKRAVDEELAPLPEQSVAALRAQELEELWQLVQERKSDLIGETDPDWTAKLVSSKGAKWGSPVSNSKWTSGEYDLQRGEATFELPTGTQLRFVGPTKFELVSPGEVRLQQGKLALRASKQDENFEVVTPSADILDLGRGFDVMVSTNGATEILPRDANLLVNRWPGQHDQKIELDQQKYDKLVVSPADAPDKPHWSELAGQRGFLGQLGIGDRLIDLESKPHFVGLRDSLVQSVDEMPEVVESEWTTFFDAFNPATRQVTIDGESRSIEDIKSFSDIVEFNWPDSEPPNRPANGQFMGQMMINGELREFRNREEYLEAMQELRNGMFPGFGRQNNVPFQTQRQKDLNNNPFQPK